MEDFVPCGFILFLDQLADLAGSFYEMVDASEVK
jgi:hypothetical protein